MEEVKKGKAGKIIGGVIGGILALIVIAVAVIYGIFFNEVNAILSFKKVDENVYYMEYNNDYFFDEFLKEGAANDNELLDFLMEKLLHGLPIKIEMPDFGCSTFTAQTQEGDRLFGRNYDLGYSPILITKTSPKNGYNSVSTTDLKTLGFKLEKLPSGLIDRLMLLAAPYLPFDGVNEKGVAISVNMVAMPEGTPTAQDTGKTPINTTTLIRLVLDKADTVEKAIELIESYDLRDSTGGPFHYQIADATGDSAIIEYVGNVIKVTRKQPDASFLCMTNFFVHPDGANEGSGFDRYNEISDTLTSTNGILSEQEALDLLEAARYKTFNPEETEVDTMWSNVFNLTDKTMTFSPYSNFEKTHKFTVSAS